MGKVKRQNAVSGENTSLEASNQSVQGNKGEGVLYVVATPIGNLEDITQRAIRVLQEVSLVAAEDTRQTRKLLSHLNLHKKIISYYKHREAVKSQEIIRRIQQGESVALVSDAGTPSISDPGALLVRAVRERGFRVVPIPGVSALTAALSVSGFEGPFTFYGFLPGRAQQRKKALSSLGNHEETLVFYEAPRRILSFLENIHEILGNRRIVVARELTKVHEEIVTGAVEQVLDIFHKRERLLGEFVVILPSTERQIEQGDFEEQIKSFLLKLRREGRISMRDAVARVSGELGMPRSQVYQKGLEVWKKEELSS